MKPSRYIKFVYDRDVLYLWNLANSAVLSFSAHAASGLRRLLRNPDSPAVTSEEEADALRSILYSEGFLLDDDIDELGNLRARYAISKKGRRTFGILVASTLQCNFRCPYCYEPHESIFLSETKQDALVKFVTENIEKWDKLSISWFGGEPLMRPDIIDRVSRRLVQVCESNSAELVGFITTNGFLLNRRNAALLNSCRVREAQITIDGSKAVHDSRRFLVDGSGTYDVILRNIFETSGFFDHFWIRVNVDSQSVGEVAQVLEALDPVKEKTHVVFMPVSKVDGYKSEMISYDEFLDKVRILNSLATDKGFRAAPLHGIPGSTYCGAYEDQYFLVDPYGDLHKCVVMVGRRDYRIGHLDDDGSVVMETDPLHRWDFDPFEDPDCLECDALPICMGGCQNLSARDKRASGRCLNKDSLPQNLLSLVRTGLQSDA